MAAMQRKFYQRFVLPHNRSVEVNQSIFSMDSLDAQPPAKRIFHLAGGLRALSVGDGEIVIQPSTTNGNPFLLREKSYASVYGDLGKIGLSIVGVDFYEHTSQLEGTAPPSWRVFQEGWPSWDQAQQWAEIANAGFLKQDGYLWDLAGKISQQFRICSLRVKQVSESYSDQLNARCRHREITGAQRFEDGFTQLAYISVQSYLTEACTLRDYLAAFAAKFLWPQHATVNGCHITTWEKLPKSLKNLVGSDLLAQRVTSISCEGGWLKQLGDYRNLAVHSAPLAIAGARLFAVVDVRPLSEAQLVPYLKLPLPENPAELSSQRSSQEHFADFQTQFDAFVRAAAGEAPSIDGLDYVWMTHGQISELSAAILARSPVKGRMIVLGESDLRGAPSFS
jgi:hypothetical protein